MCGMTVWPSGLRRWLQAPVRKGVGSNPTAVTGCPTFRHCSDTHLHVHGWLPKANVAWCKKCQSVESSWVSIPSGLQLGSIRISLLGPSWVATGQEARRATKTKRVIGAVVPEQYTSFSEPVQAPNFLSQQFLATLNLRQRPRTLRGRVACCIFSCSDYEVLYFTLDLSGQSVKRCHTRFPFCSRQISKWYFPRKTFGELCHLIPGGRMVGQKSITSFHQNGWAGYE